MAAHRQQSPGDAFGSLPRRHGFTISVRTRQEALEEHILDDLIEARSLIAVPAEGMQDIDEVQGLPKSYFPRYQESEPQPDWLETFYGVARDGETKIAMCEARLIYRHKMRHEFWKQMQQSSPGTSDLALTIFDRYGRLEAFHKNKGTRLWGEELDEGNLLVLEHMTVIPAHRRRRVGTRLVGAVFVKIREHLLRVAAQSGEGLFDSFPHFSFVRPDAAKGARSTTGVDAAARFWRSLGFRRIGTTCWFAYATSDRSHPAHSLKPGHDWFCSKMAKSEDSGAFSVEDNPIRQIKTLIKLLADTDTSDNECFAELNRMIPL